MGKARVNDEEWQPERVFRQNSVDGEVSKQAKAMIIPAEWKGRHKHDAAQSKDVEQLALLALEHVEEAALGRASCLQRCQENQQTIFAS
jgi:hypothetical protein